jgi:hypothetical protein
MKRRDGKKVIERISSQVDRVGSLLGHYTATKEAKERELDLRAYIWSQLLR